MRSLAIAAAIALPVLSVSADPWENPFASGNAPGGAVRWDRGTANTAFAQWDVFYDAFGGLNYADDGVFGGTNPTFDNLSLFGKPEEGTTATPGTGTGASWFRQTNPTAWSFIVAPGFLGNIYSFGGADELQIQTFELNLSGFTGLNPVNPGEYQELVITTRTEGTEIDYAGIIAPAGAEFLGRRELLRIDDGQNPQNQTISYIIEQQWRFDITGLTGDLFFQFATETSSVSFQKLAADTGIVPTPASAAVLAFGGVLAARRRRG